jgi:hypothetical protein
MVISQENIIRPAAILTVTWEKLPDGYKLEEEPVENTGQPLIAGALREPLELIGYIKPEMLIASNLGICLVTLVGRGRKFAAVGCRTLGAGTPAS